MIRIWDLESILNYAKRSARAGAFVGTMAAFYLSGCGPADKLPYIGDDSKAPTVTAPSQTGTDTPYTPGTTPGQPTGPDQPQQPDPAQPSDPNIPVTPPVVPVEPVCVTLEYNLEGAVDFYSAMNKANQFAKLFSSLIHGFSFDPDTGDANGPYNHDTESVVPNGIPDLQEFNLISVVLNNPGLDLSKYGGVTYDITLQAWNQNVSRVAQDFRDKALSLVKGAETVFPGYIMLGDDDSCYIPRRLSELAIEHMAFLGVTKVDLANYVRLDKYFGPNGDASGSGATNLQKYQHCIANGLDYAAVALDPCFKIE